MFFLLPGTFSPCVTWYTCVCPYCGVPTLFQACSRCLIHVQRMNECNVRIIGGWVMGASLCSWRQPVLVMLPIYPSCLYSHCWDSNPIGHVASYPCLVLQHRSGLQRYQQLTWPSAVRLDSDHCSCWGWEAGPPVMDLSGSRAFCSSLEILFLGRQISRLYCLQPKPLTA